MVIRNDVAEVLIGTWLQGEHLEDVGLLAVNDFGELSDIARVIKAGTHNPIDVARITKRAVADIGRLINYGLVNMYESAVADIKHDKMTTELAEACGKRAKVDKVKEIIRKYDVSTVEPVEACKDIVEAYIMELDKRRDRDVVMTGISSLDDILYGIRPKELTSIGARPSVGKSAFMLQVATTVAKSGKKVLYFPLEMTKEQTVERIISRYLSKTPSNALRSGRLTPEQRSEVEIYLGRVDSLDKSGNFKIYEGCGQLEQIVALVEKEKPYMIVIDQLQQMKAGKQFLDVRSRFSYMTSELQSLAMSHDCAVWLACQVNRVANQNANNEPTLENLKESGSIEEDSDNVIILHRDEQYEAEHNTGADRVIQINVAKQRSGPTNKVRVCFKPERCTFYAMETAPKGFESYRTNDIPFEKEGK